MKVKELVEALQAFDPETEVVIDGLHGYEGGQTQSAHLKLDKGFFVTNPGDLDDGFHVDEKLAHREQSDGKELLDLDSPYIRPSVMIKWDRYSFRN